MPKFEYYETYNNGTPVSDAISNVVYVPVKGIINTETGELINGVPKLFKNYRELRSYNNPSATATDLGADYAYESTNKSYALIRALLERGMYVLVEGVKEEASTISTVVVETTYTPVFETNKYYVSNGEPDPDTDYTLLTEEPADWGLIDDKYFTRSGEGPEYVYTSVDFTANTTTTSTTTTITKPIIDFDRLKDKNLFDFRFISFGGYDAIDNDTIGNAIACAYERKDCVVLVDHPKDVEDLPIGSKYINEKNVTDYVAKVRTYFERFIDINDAVKTSFATATTPWVKVNMNNIVMDDTKKVTKAETLEIPASYGYLFAFANGVKIKNSANWFPMAGSFRGIIPGLVDVDYEYSSAEIEVLQGRSDTSEVKLDNEFDNNGIGINPIALVNPYGYIVWGNRTMYVNDANKEDNRPNYRAFLNIRHLVISIAKQSFIARNKYCFEPNTDILWTNYRAMITPLLDSMQNGLGINGYKMTKVKTNAKARCSAKIDINPIEGVEDFTVEVQLNDSVDVIEQ